MTGAAGQVGEALATHLRRQADLVLAVDAQPGPDIAAVDVTDLAFGTLLREQVERHDVNRVELFHAAAALGTRVPIARTGVGEFTALVEANLTSAFAALAGVADVLEGYQLTGSAVVLSSVGAHRAHRYQPAYDAAKAGTESLVRSFALEYGDLFSPRAVAVGPIAESSSTATDGRYAADLVALVPRGSYMKLTDLTAALDAFAGPAFDAACGQVLVLDGGLSVQLRPAVNERPPD
ncbi:SDR family oxidoreductase [Myceligenerans halotolerans]